GRRRAPAPPARHARLLVVAAQGSLHIQRRGPRTGPAQARRHALRDRPRRRLAARLRALAQDALRARRRDQDQRPARPRGPAGQATAALGVAAPRRPRCDEITSHRPARTSSGTEQSGLRRGPCIASRGTRLGARSRTLSRLVTRSRLVALSLAALLAA